MKTLRPKIQMIFQDPYSSLDPHMTMGASILEIVRKNKTAPAGEATDYVLSVLDKCGVPGDFFDRFPHEVSGGQRQRVSIARALALKPEVIVCDEPVSALDVSIQAQIINLLMEIQNSEGIAYLFISHDLAVVRHISQYVAVMYLGRLVESADKTSLFSRPTHPYTQALLSAVPPDMPGTKSDRMILSGEIPSAEDVPSGCAFRTRCPVCVAECGHIRPQIREIAPGHKVACIRV